jgi:simple sugar transport system permease protein
VTLGGLFFLRGVTIATSHILVGRPLVGGVLDPIRSDPLLRVFAGKPLGFVDIAVIWWIVTAALATYVLYSTSFGNWIFGTGGSPQAARTLAVPVIGSNRPVRRGVAQRRPAGSRTGAHIGLN